MPSLQDRYYFSSYSQSLPMYGKHHFIPSPSLYASANTPVSSRYIPVAKLRHIPVPSKIQRQQSDKTAMVSAAQTLLSLTPLCNHSSPVTPTTSPESKISSVKNSISSSPSSTTHQLSLTTTKTTDHSLDIAIPELIEDRCCQPTKSPQNTNDSCPTSDNGSPKHSNLTNNYFLGSTSLALPEDEEFLSPMHCFMRKYCVEAFANEYNPVHEASKQQQQQHAIYSRRIQMGQVGIRCLFCKNQNTTKTIERAVCFPSSLPNIYHSIETWQRRHARVCPHIPGSIRHELTKLKCQSRSGAGGRRHYWVTSAQRLGIVETEYGLRFSHPPGILVEIPSTSTSLSSLSESQKENTPNETNTATTTTSTITATSVPCCHVSLVRSEERSMVTDYLFLLMEQMEMCYFTDQDRQGTRSKNNHQHAYGFPGMQCRHCHGKAGCGRYFPASLRALTSANSDRNLWNHLKKCRKCPDRIREQIDQLHIQSQNEKNRRGSRKQFFTNVWYRIHSGDTKHNTESVK